MLGKGSVELSHIDPTLKELLQSIVSSDESEQIKSQKADDGSNGQYYVMHGIFDSMIYAGHIAKNSVLMWTKKTRPVSYRKILKILSNHGSLMSVFGYQSELWEIWEICSDSSVKDSVY